MDRTDETLTDKNRKAEECDGRLQSIAALLLSFAVLAERTIAASAPVRFLVLWILRYAERVAWNLVAREVFGDDVPPDARHTPIRTGNSAEDAALLALSFRALADALNKLVREEEMFERRLARWERSAEQDKFDLTLGRTGRPNAVVQPGSPIRLLTLVLSNIFLAPVAIIDTS